MGRSTAIKLSMKKNSRLIIVGRNMGSLEETRSLMKNKESHIISSMDIRNDTEWKKLFSSMDQDFSIEGVFANAGIGGENHYGTDDRWNDIISTNLTGTYITIMESVPYLKQSHQLYRHVVITSSCLARFGVPHYTAYCTAKTGLLGLTRSLALELASDNILVNAICPGWVETEMAKAGIQKLADREGISYEKSFLDQMSLVPLNRISQPAEIANLVDFLMSGLQSSITGQAIDINNGSFMI